MMMATIVAGAMAWAVHFLNKVIPEAEYSKFGVLLTVIGCVPTMPLQMVFTHQAAITLAEERTRQLAGMIHRALVWSFVLWLIPAVGVAIFHERIDNAWHLTSSAGLYIAVLAVLGSVWSPLFSGLLQGRQDFFWLGWSMIGGGVFRIAGAVALVMVFHLGATGMLAGTLAGVAAAGLICVWRTRDLWGQAPEPFNAREVFSQIVPLLLGFGACQFLFTTDTMYVTPHFSGDAMKGYIAAGTLSRALLWVVLPMAAVMFPKIVHSSAKGEKNNLLGVVIAGTALLGVCGVVGLWLVGPLIVKFVYRSEDVSATTALLPWYASAMIPLALGNVLANDLLARGRFKVVPFMILVALGYAFTLPYMLNHFLGDMTVALKTLGIFNVLLFLVCAVFTWGVKYESAAPVTPQSA